MFRLINGCPYLILSYLFKMRKHICCLCIVFAHLFCASGVTAQQDSLRIIDSLNAVLLKEYTVRMANIELQRVADSTQKAKLLDQIGSLDERDTRRKEKLEDELKQLDEQEAMRMALKKVRIDSLRATAKPSPVIGFFEDTLFSIYSRLGSFSAKERADAINRRLLRMGNTFAFSKDSMIVVQSESTTDIMYGETIVMTITENDALWQNSTTDALGHAYRSLFVDAIEAYRSAISFGTLAQEIGQAFLVLLVLLVLIYLLRRLFLWTAGRIRLQEGKLIKGVVIDNYVLLTATRQMNALLWVNKLVKWLLMLVAIYMAFPIIFSLFPWTESFADTLVGYVLYPAKKIVFGVWDYLPDLVTIVVILLVFRFVLKGLRYLRDEVDQGRLVLHGFYADWANPTYQIIRGVLYAFNLIVIFPYLPGSDSDVFKGVSVFLGVLITFGSSGSLSNVIAGLVLTYMRLFKMGDRVKIGDVLGDVIETTLLVTRIRSVKNEIISIPNSTVMNSHTINYSSDTTDKGLILHTTVTIGYDVPWREMHKALLCAADRTDLLLKEPQPFVLQTGLEDFYVAYQLNVYTKEANSQAAIYSQLHANIQDCCNEVGIEILSPHYRAARDGNASTIPAEHLPKDYVVPGFQVHVTTAGA